MRVSLDSFLFLTISVLGACATADVEAHDAGSVEAGSRIQVLMTDAPGDFDEVWVDITRVEIESEAGWLVLADEPQSFDLLTLQNDVTAALAGAVLQPGAYQQLRLIVDHAHVVTGGVTEDLKIASGAQTGIKLVLDAEILDGMTYKLVLDFDAGKSVKHTGQGWLMTPVVMVKELTGRPTEEEPPPVE